MAFLQHLTTWVPENRIDLSDNNYGKDFDFIKNKTGFTSKAISEELYNNKSLTLALNACKKLIKQTNYDINKVDVILFVNQSEKRKLPHLSSLLHRYLNIKNQKIFTSDIGLGCTGFVQALQLAKVMIDSNEYENVLVVTSDQYPDYLSKNDHNTQLIFGEGASASIISKNKIGYKLSKFRNHIDSSNSDAIKFDEEDFISMNGRKVLEYVMTSSLRELKQMIADNNLEFDNRQKCIFIPHQGSKYIIDMLCKKLGINSDGLFCSSEIGNLVSSSLPFAFEEILGINSNKNLILPENVLLAGFGVGLSTSCILLEK